MLILCCSLIGQALEDALNPRLKVAHVSARGFRLRPLVGRGRGRAVSALLETDDLHVWFDLPRGGTLHAVQGVSFGLERGERLGLVGESGCGKTTTALALMGLLPPSASGRRAAVLLNGVDILRGGEETMRPHRWVDLAMVFQGAMNAFNPVKTVGSQIVEVLELHGIASGRGARSRTGELLEPVGIPRRSRRPLSARVLGRDAAARRNRDGACLQSERPHCRRADDGARRHGAGADPRAARCTLPRLRAGIAPGDS